MKTLKLLLLIYLLAPSISFAQILKLGDLEIEFGKGIEKYKNLWGENDQLEVDDLNMNAYEGENINGIFYKNRLFQIILWFGNDSIYSMRTAVDEILSVHSPIKIEDVIEYDEPAQLIYYKVDDFSITIHKYSFNTSYYITSIKYANKLKAR